MKHFTGLKVRGGRNSTIHYLWLFKILLLLQEMFVQMTWKESELCNLILGEYRGKNVCGENTHKPCRTLVPKASVI